ncbi:hypothetical protein AC249_AIPGENE6152 [Exaiptasia diaphana]|nr:hypothetical protein AC249_AIPGENE6152 [Exaiptasia diaphana]
MERVRKKLQPPFCDRNDITKTGCIERSLVGENRLNISNSAYTASSFLYDSKQRRDDVTGKLFWDRRYVPHGARLYGPFGWSPRDNDNPEDYLQLDLGAVRAITAVATQGNGFFELNEWIKTFKLRFKQDTSSTKWIEYEETLQNCYMAMRVNVVFINQEAARVNATPSERSIFVQWTIQPCGKLTQLITGYLVDISTKEARKSVRVAGPRNTSKNITGLQPYTEYKIRVKSVPYGLWSDNKTIQTTAEAARVNATPSERSIFVQWTIQPCGKLTQLITGYLVDISTKEARKSVRVAGPRNTSKNITGLQPYTEYKIRVKSVPYGLWSDNKTIQTTAVFCVLFTSLLMQCLEKRLPFAGGRNSFTDFYY